MKGISLGLSWQRPTFDKLEGQIVRLWRNRKIGKGGCESQPLDDFARISKPCFIANDARREQRHFRAASPPSTSKCLSCSFYSIL